MKKKAETYDTMVKHHNRNISKQVVCECGKITCEKQIEKHRTTGVHKLLMYYKDQRDRMMKEQPEQEKTERKYLTTWDKVVLEKS